MWRRSTSGPGRRYAGGSIRWRLAKADGWDPEPTRAAESAPPAAPRPRAAIRRLLLSRRFRTRSRLSGSWARPHRRRRHPGLPPSCSDSANLVGSKTEPLQSSIAGRRAAASATATSLPTLSGSRSMSSSRQEPYCSGDQAGDIGCPDRIRNSGGSRRYRPRREPCAPGRQRHRLVAPIPRSCG
jgi:hypothetical protein